MAAATSRTSASHSQSWAWPTTGRTSRASRGLHPRPTTGLTRPRPTAATADGFAWDPTRAIRPRARWLTRCSTALASAPTLPTRATFARATPRASGAASVPRSSCSSGTTAMTCASRATPSTYGPRMPSSSNCPTPSTVPTKTITAMPPTTATPCWHRPSSRTDWLPWAATCRGWPTRSTATAGRLSSATAATTSDCARRASSTMAVRSN